MMYVACRLSKQEEATPISSLLLIIFYFFDRYNLDF